MVLQCGQTLLMQLKQNILNKFLIFCFALFKKQYTFLKVYCFCLIILQNHNQLLDYRVIKS